ncbi:MAG: hypothetical protein HYV07_14420 [Deltaproteobacteria bacterium]|nr:hypothetical protein [Deltaproteobacteria bacterium]
MSTSRSSFGSWFRAVAFAAGMTPFAASSETPEIPTGGAVPEPAPVAGAKAEPPAPPPHQHEKLSYESSAAGIVLGAKVGVAQPLEALDTSFGLELEVGWLLPPLDRSFELALAARFSAPQTDGGSATDPRLPGDGVMSYDAVTQQLALGLQLFYRVPVTSFVRPYLGAGGGLILVKTTVDATAGGQAFGTRTETATRPAFVASLGADWMAGPGAVVTEVALELSSIDGDIISDTSLGWVGISLGYRLFL